MGIPVDSPETEALTVRIMRRIRRRIISSPIITISSMVAILSQIGEIHAEETTTTEGTGIIAEEDAMAVTAEEATIRHNNVETTDRPMMTCSACFECLCGYNQTRLRIVAEEEETGINHRTIKIRIRTSRRTQETTTTTVRQTSDVTPVFLSELRLKRVILYRIYYYLNQQVNLNQLS